jgi:hypothetical protein
MSEHNARLTLRLSPVTSNREPQHYMSLVVQDVISGHHVAEFELLGDDLMELLGNRQVGSVDGVAAWLIEAKDRQVLGKRKITTTRRFSMFTHNDDTLARWAKRNAGAAGAHTFGTHKNNASQIVVTFVHYTECDTEQQAEELRALKQATMDVLAPPAVN